MHRTVKAILILVLLVAIALVSIYAYRVATADRTASRLVLQYCQRNGYDTTKLVGPRKEDVPHTAAAYRWEYRADAHDLRFFLAFHGFYALTEFDVFDRKKNQTFYPLEDRTL